MSTNNLSPRAELQMRMDGQRVMRELDAHLRRQRKMAEADEVIPCGDATESCWGDLEAAQRAQP